MSSNSGVCDNQTVSYSHRVYDAGASGTLMPLDAAQTAVSCTRQQLVLCFADNYDWCIVPDTGYDVILLAGIAVVVACICQGRLSNLMVLVAGQGLRRHCCCVSVPF